MEYENKEEALKLYLKSTYKYDTSYDDYLNGNVKNFYKKELSNSSLLDIGIYPLFLVVSLLGIPKKIVVNGKVLENRNGIDIYGTLNLNYDEKDATVTYSKIYNSYNPAEIIGENGTFLIEHLSEMDTLHFVDRKNGEKKELTVPRKDNAMYYELKHFIQLFENGKTESPINSFDVTLKMM